MKKNRILLFILLLFVLFVGKVKADVDTTCNPSSHNELLTEASNIKVTYETVTIEGEKYYDEDGRLDWTDYIDYFDVKIYNLTSRMYLKYTAQSSDETMRELNGTITLNDATNGAITLRQKVSDYLTNYTFEVYSDDYGCSSKKLRTIKLTLPRRNTFAYLAVCSDTPDFYLCSDYVTFYFDDYSEFMNKYNDYKAKLDIKNQVGEESNPVSETISKVSKYKYVVIGIILAIGVIVTVIIVIRKRSEA